MGRIEFKSKQVMVSRKLMKYKNLNAINVKTLGHYWLVQNDEWL